MKKINQYKKTYYKEQGAMLGLVLAFVIFGLPVLFGNGTESYVAEPEVLSPRVVCFDTFSGKVTQFASGTPMKNVKKQVTEDCYIGTDEFLDKKIKSETVEAKIMHYFPRNGKKFVAIAKAESGLKMSAVGYNCLYNKYAIYKDGVLVNATGTVLQQYSGDNVMSTHCAKKDRAMAWSIDCGILQMNTLEKQCPKETINQHLARAAEFSKLRGPQAWSSYNDGKHLQHLANN